MAAAAPIFSHDDGSPPVGSEAEAEARLRGLVRNVRVGVQVVSQAVAASAGGVAAVTRPEVAVRAASVEAAFAGEGPDVEEALREATLLLGRAPVLFDQWGDSVREIDSCWNRMLAARPPAEATAVDLARAGTLSAPLAARILYLVAIVTVPPRLNDHLRAVRVGKALDFSEAFADELPDAAARTAFLQYLAARPSAVQGIVDVERGIIIRTSPSASKRLATVLVPPAAAVLAALGILAVASLGRWLDLDSWPSGFSDRQTLLAAYVFVLLGATAHVLVDLLKQVRFGNGPFIALGDVLAWLHVRYLSIAASVGWVVVGTLGLALTDSLAWATAFFVGYSLDSLGGLFLDRFTAVASKTSLGVAQSLK
jgi:hypothetical protein